MLSGARCPCASFGSRSSGCPSAAISENGNFLAHSACIVHVSEQSVKDARVLGGESQSGEGFWAKFNQLHRMWGDARDPREVSPNLTHTIPACIPKRGEFCYEEGLEKGAKSERLEGGQSGECLGRACL